MNAIQYVLQRVVQSGIPKQILELAFGSRYRYDTYNHYTIESKIRQEVLDGRVLIDCNTVNTTNLTVPLALCERLNGTSSYTSIWNVPRSATQGRRIIYPLNVTNAAGTVLDSSTGASGDSNGIPGMGTWTNMNNQFDGQSAVSGGLQQAVRSVSPIEMVSDALVYMVGDNSVLIKNIVIMPGSMFLRVCVEMDSEMSNISPPYYLSFYKLCLLAIKAHIYNVLVVDQDTAFINSGGELNKVRDILESYADAADEYDTYLEEEWFGSQLLNDSESQRQHYQSRTGGGY